MTRKLPTLTRFPEYRPEGLPETSRLPRARPGVLVAITALAVWAFWQLELGPLDLLRSSPNLQLVGEFFVRALSPALDYEASNLPEGLMPLPLRALQAAGNTVVFALAAMSLAVPLGLVLGFLASSSWWSQDPAGGLSPRWRFVRKTVRPLVYEATRLLITAMRSVHELLWAVLLLAAFGLLNVTAVIALAIPFTGVLAKIFAEIIDETPRDTAYALRGAGASPFQVFLFALLPRAFPDLAAYAFYRFECALRSSAVLGFFGFPTLGFFIAASFENLYYGEVWTYLYALFLLVVLVEWWSGAIRKRFVT
jgi:phosphonate transport system permease protein